MNVERNVLLSRFTTLGTGGPAAAFARPETVDELQESLRFAHDRGLPVAVVGLGSNLLVADSGFGGLVLKLAGQLARAEVRDDLLVAGGGAPNAVALHRARAAGLGGFEFACAIPGTTGGGVRMNAGAYGSDWAAILVRARVARADDVVWRGPDDLGLSYRSSALARGEVVAEVEFQLERRSVDEIKHRVAELTAQRKATQ